MKIGVGAEGAVYKHMYKGQDVAVKVPSKLNFPHTKRSKEYLDMRKEAVFLQKLQHPYLMGIIAVTTSPLCLVLEYAAHSSLNKVLDYHLQEYGLGSMKNGVLGTILTHQIAIEVASALDYLHRNSIIYFDLKSANLLVMSLDMYSQLHIKLTDYGISEMIVPKGFRGYKGTAGFMAPELFPEEGVFLAVDQKVDVYSYAMFLCELLFGRNPAAGDRNVLDKVRNGVRPVCSSKEIPIHMLNLIQRCWEQLPQMRPSTNEILQELSEVKFVIKNKASNINTRGKITGAYQIVTATLPSEKGIDLTKSMMDSLFPPNRNNITLSNSSSGAKDLSGSYNPEIRGCTPNLQSKFQHINQTDRYEMFDGPTNRADFLDIKSCSTRATTSDDSVVVISSSTEEETDIILMNTTTGEYFNDIRIEYPHVTSILIYNSFMWLAATHDKGDPGVIMMYSLPQMNLMFEEREDCVRKLVAFPIEETEQHMEINLIVVLAREIASYQIQLSGDFLHAKESQRFDIVNFSKSTVYMADGSIGSVCTVNNNELWLCYGKNNAAYLVVLDMSFQVPKVIDVLPPINNVVEVGDIVFAGKCIWLNDKRELNIWKIDYQSRRIHEFSDLVHKKESKYLGRNGSIIQKTPEPSRTRKNMKTKINPHILNFNHKSYSYAEECRASLEITPLKNVNPKMMQKLDYLSQSNRSLKPGLDHIDIIDMYCQAGAVDAPISSLHVGRETVWTFLEDGKICICDANTAFDQLSVLCIIKTQAEYYSAKHLKIPAAITMTDSHVIIIRKASNKEVIDMDGFDYYVEVWHNLTADEIRCYNRVVQAAHRAV
ncbi:Leucine-rich repeat serine/threonine-protein kinase 1 isoform X2 [Oopsacas minuta]|uniref:Leucine-rich repeat serine/threonine-protein kinase 1 isoform X2 n=1 Tax=Oopsacas minuta TaxID=111878 RepID=A0AAV7JAT1_9METZ|nr:Leucine-rich repeat serine/threonine-protein kinase 1 isoform X2 [Oopsacas minuta]